MLEKTLSEKLSFQKYFVRAKINVLFYRQQLDSKWTLIRQKNVTLVEFIWGITQMNVYVYCIVVVTSFFSQFFISGWISHGGNCFVVHTFQCFVLQGKFFCNLRIPWTISFRIAYQIFYVRNGLGDAPLIWVQVTYSDSRKWLHWICFHLNTIEILLYGIQFLSYIYGNGSKNITTVQLLCVSRTLIQCKPD